jgi:hypothetical protein
MSNTRNSHYRFVGATLMLPLAPKVTLHQIPMNHFRMCHGYTVTEGEEVLEEYHYKL